MAKKSMLDGRVYIVERVGLDDFVVSRARLQDGAVQADGSYRVVGPDCSCRAGDFNETCKHRRMTAGTLEGPPYDRAEATVLFERFLDNLKKGWPESCATSLLQFREGPVTVASALLFGDDGHPDGAKRLTIWGEYEGLLTRTYYFSDYDEYRKTLRNIRRETT